MQSTRAQCDRRVMPSHLQRLRRKINTEHTASPSLKRQRNRDTPRAGSHIDQGTEFGPPLQHRLDQQFRLRPRNQNIRRNPKVPAVKLLPLRDVLSRLPLDPLVADSGRSGSIPPREAPAPDARRSRPARNASACASRTSAFSRGSATPARARSSVPCRTAVRMFRNHGI